MNRPTTSRQYNRESRARIANRKKNRESEKHAADFRILVMAALFMTAIAAMPLIPFIFELI